MLTKFDIQTSEPYGAFAGTAFVIHHGTAHFRVDPNAGENASITDLRIAPTDADGTVVFDSDFSLVAPERPLTSAKLLVEIPNRGRRLSFGMFNRAGRATTLENPTAPGDGFLFERGFALLSVGWQWDIGADSGLGHRAPRLQGLTGEVVARVRTNRPLPYAHYGQLGAVAYSPADPADPGARLYRREHPNAPDEVLPRESWGFGRGRDEDVLDNSYLWLEDGFEPGVFYTLVYTARDPAVAGTGLLAIRDTALYARGTLGYRHVYAFGASQTGRLLRHFLHAGLNRDASGSVVFDALLPHIAGAQRGDFNHRFAQPSAAGAPSFGQLPPYGTFAAAAAPARVMITNTSFEYWRGDAGLAHVAPDGRADLEPAGNARVYAFAGTHHINGVLPPIREVADIGERAQLDFNTVDYGPLLRAALVNLDRWVREGVPPPASRHPRREDGTAVERSHVLARFEGDPALAAVKLPHMTELDLDVDESGAAHYPASEGMCYAALVSDVDQDLNEVGGIRLPDLSVPIGTHTGWNPRDPTTGAADQPAIFVGFSRFFTAAEIRRRYRDKGGYEARVREAARRLAAERYVLDEDVDLVVGNALDRWDVAMAGT